MELQVNNTMYDCVCSMKADIIVRVMIFDKNQLIDFLSQLSKFGLSCGYKEEDAEGVDYPIVAIRDTGYPYHVNLIGSTLKYAITKEECVKQYGNEDPTMNIRAELYEKSLKGGL